MSVCGVDAVQERSVWGRTCQATSQGISGFDDDDFC